MIATTTSKTECTCTIDRGYLNVKPQKRQIYIRILRACPHRTPVENLSTLDNLVKDPVAASRARAACEKWHVPLEKLHNRLVNAILKKPEPELTQEEAEYGSHDNTITDGECEAERIPIERRGAKRKLWGYWDPAQPLGGQMSPKAWEKEMARRKLALAEELKKKDGSDGK